MNSYKKPPIGATPAFIAIPSRIKDLASSISRYTEAIAWQPLPELYQKGE